MCRGLWPVSLVAGSWEDIGPEGQNKTVTPPSPPLPSWCQEVSVGATPISGVDVTLFQQSLGHPLGGPGNSHIQYLVKAALPGWGAGVQGWAMSSILPPRVLWVPLNALVPKWIPEGILDPLGLGLWADSWAQLVAGGITDVPSAWVSMGTGGGEREQAERRI